MENHLISVLIPFKNTADFLPECLDSILAQNYQNWEVIAVDDHSTDSSRSILDKYSSYDPRFRVYSNDGKGIISALRKAFSLSKGAFLTRMDSDDIMISNKLEIMVSSLEKYGEGHIAVGGVRYFSERGISNGYERYEKWLNELTAKGTNYSEIYKECVIPSPCWMVFRKDLEESGAFNSDRYPEDYDLTFRFYEQGLKCIPCRNILHLWRDYDWRTSRTSEHYAQNYFLHIKLHYFLKLHHDPTKPLAVWGAGNKGKSIAKDLKNRNIPFYWLCDNPQKIGKNIYGVEMKHFNHLLHLEMPQSIVTVANGEAQEMIVNYLSDLNQAAMVDYFFFC
ncbi:glycosyltransferase [uncultured Eudoraea sp.]|uniref:glycosyltransferase n=1 Tax=uncultured Eudoraea sp. TaxID=1035614 RepID=UPI00261D2D7E|nr:glycosyltransferase [uncultured Eudoraea sp.]